VSGEGLFPSNEVILSCRAFVATWSIFTGDNDNLMLLVFLTGAFIGEGVLDEGTLSSCVRDGRASSCSIEEVFR